jgi:hypothetical protein
LKWITAHSLRNLPILQRIEISSARPGEVHRLFVAMGIEINKYAFDTATADLRERYITASDR